MSGFTAYQQQAKSHRLTTADPLYALLNLSGEVGELHSLIAKALRDGRKPDFLDNVKKELGDILWCLAAVADDFDLGLSDVAQANLTKLASRSQRGTLGGSGDNR